MFNQKEYNQIISEIPENIKILGVTKTKFAEDITEAVNSGIKIIGENYVPEAKEKYEKLKDFFKEKEVSFHLIGHLQSNKVKDAVKMFSCIETIDSIKLAEKINKECIPLNKKIDVMIEINFDELQKSGIKIGELDSLISKINSLGNLNLIGLMSIPPIGKEKESFRIMKKLNEKYKFKELSMGMSSDYKIAIENGATIIRLGTILFGERDN
jgi:PLP dependent protein